MVLALSKAIAHLLISKKEEVRFTLQGNGIKIIGREHEYTFSLNENGAPDIEIQVDHNDTFGQIFLTTTQVHLRHGIPPYKTRRLCARGKLHYIRDGRKWLIAEDSIKEYLKTSKEK